MMNRLNAMEYRFFSFTSFFGGKALSGCTETA